MKKGFTLIEFLITVAIVTLLATLIFPSINGAYAKANDARRKAEMHNLKISIATESPNDYSNIFSEEGQIKTTLENLIEFTGAESGEYDAISGEDYFLIVIPTKSSEDEYFCLDQDGDIAEVDRRFETGDRDCDDLILEEAELEQPSLEVCEYAAPPANCDYVPGPDYDEETYCGMELECSGPGPGPAPVL